MIILNSRKKQELHNMESAMGTVIFRKFGKGNKRHTGISVNAS